MFIVSFKNIFCSIFFITLFMGVTYLLSPIYQPAEYTEFADTRTFKWIGISIPNFMDVITNLPYLIFGLIGLALIYFRKKYLSKNLFCHLLVIFIGLVITSIGSSYFHLVLDKLSLFIDRIGIAIVISGILGLVIYQKLNQKLSVIYSIIFLLILMVSNYYWYLTNDLAPWSIAQVLGIVIVFVLGFKSNIDLKFPTINYWLIITLYLIAKICEFSDNFFFEITNNIISGHSIKHLISSLAAIPILIFILKCKPHKIRE